VRVLVDAARVHALELRGPGQVQQGEIRSVDDVQAGIAEDQQALERRGTTKKSNGAFLKESYVFESSHSD